MMCLDIHVHSMFYTRLLAVPSSAGVSTRQQCDSSRHQERQHSPWHGRQRQTQSVSVSGLSVVLLLVELTAAAGTLASFI